MYTLSYPWLLLLVFVPLILRWLLPAYKEPRVALHVPWFERMAKLLRQAESRGIAPDYVGALLAVLDSETKDEGRRTNDGSFVMGPASDNVYHD